MRAQTVFSARLDILQGRLAVLVEHGRDVGLGEAEQRQVDVLRGELRDEVRQLLVVELAAMRVGRDVRRLLFLLVPVHLAPGPLTGRRVDVSARDGAGLVEHLALLGAVLDDDRPGGVQLLDALVPADEPAGPDVLDDAGEVAELRHGFGEVLGLGLADFAGVVVRGFRAEVVDGFAHGFPLSGVRL
jgi:hypothetical protein